MIHNRETLLTLTADIVAAHVGNNVVDGEQIGPLIAGVFGALSGLGAPVEEAAPDYVPAISPARSIKADHLVSLIDGKPYKMLKRYLANHGLTPNAYRGRYGLKSDYPMIAPDYAEKRRAIALKIGLGKVTNVRRRKSANRPKPKA